MPHRMRSKRPIEDSPFNTIPRIIQIMPNLEQSSTKWTRPTTPFPLNLEDIIMIFFHSVKLHLFEHITFSKTSGATDLMNSNKLTTCSGLFWETNGVGIWISGWEKETMKTGETLKTPNHIRPQLTTQIRTESNQRSPSLLRQSSKTEFLWPRPLRSTSSQMETSRFVKLKTMEKEMSLQKFTIWRREKTFLSRIDLHASLFE